MLFFIAAVVVGTATALGNSDQLTNGLPGTTFQFSASQYAGYLPYQTGGGGQMHYWYIESDNSTYDPLILFISGGTGSRSSSVFTLLEQLGPFRPYPDNATLFENVFSWNKVANLLAIDLPGAGFSSPNSNVTSDMLYAVLEEALRVFYGQFQSLNSNALFIVANEKAAYLAAQLATSMQNGPYGTPNPMGLIFLGGKLNQLFNGNAQVTFNYMHSYMNSGQFNAIYQACCNGKSVLSCNFVQSTDSTCYNLLQQYRVPSSIDSTNIYQDCYAPGGTSNPYVQQQSTDPFKGYPCTSETSVLAYLTSQSKILNNNNNKFNQFTTQYPFGDIEAMLKTFVNHPTYANRSKLVLINGDLDAVNNFVGTQFFAQDFAKTQGYNVVKDGPWRANYYRFIFNDTDGGLRTDYENNFHVVSIRGAGSFPALSRPAQTLQIIRNAIRFLDYNNCLSALNLGAKPLLAKYQSLAAGPTRKQQAKVTDLPGLTFKLNFNHYSGFLYGNVHFWFVESQHKPENAPLLIWLTGQPKESALKGLFLENGPFRINRGGATISENIFSWNKYANVLYLENPVAGFSTSQQNSSNDDGVTSAYYSALQDFFVVFPEFANSPLFIGGRNFAGVIGINLANMIQSDPKNNLKGLILGNPQLSAKQNANGLIFQMYTYGLIGRTEYDELTTKCCASFTDKTQCDYFTQYLTIDDQYQYQKNSNADQWCANQTYSYVTDWVWNTLNDPNSLYEDCYNYNNQGPTHYNPQWMPFKDYASLINSDSSDAYNSIACWGDEALETYLNLPSVQTSIHISSPQQYRIINPNVSFQRKYFEMDGQLQKFLSNQAGATSTLFYSGDTALSVSHLGIQYFINSFANANNYTAGTHTGWLFHAKATTLVPQTVGFEQVFTNNQSISVNVATVKGSGMFVAQDRPRPALQMFHNFINGYDLTKQLTMPATASSLLNSFAKQTPCIIATSSASAEESMDDVKKPKKFDFNLTAKAAADQIQNLDALTFTPPYRMFSGYLHPEIYPQNHLFYWFIESQNDPQNDPVVLWLNGGPGCSSISGLFEELGPLHVNNDNYSIYENVFGWNKKANVIFLESPVYVGYSYTDDKTFQITDDTTAVSSAFAMKYFFEELFPYYQSNEFFITGESYAGVYIPTLTYQLIQLIEAHNITINFKGIAIGNGYLSRGEQVNSEVPLQYGHGMDGKQDWDSLKTACGVQDPTYYNYHSATNLACLLASSAFIVKWNKDINDPYNMYEDCYDVPVPEFNNTKKKRRTKRDAMIKPFQDNNAYSYYGASDNNMGLYCYGDSALIPLMNRPDIRQSIHAHEGLRYTVCTDFTLKQPYQSEKTYYDMTETMKNILKSNWYTQNSMRIMLYNGDIDTQCQFLGDQWFAENLVKEMKMTVVYDRRPWYYQKTPSSRVTLAGYEKAWSNRFTQITVKGAGHMVPGDRPGEALQMLLNFLADSGNYSVYQPHSITPTPLYQNYSLPSSLTQPCGPKDADRVLFIPGLTDFNSNMYSGFLQGSPTHFYHYWYIDTESKNPTAPMILWISGGPGASSFKGLFEEHGPFRLNRDGFTVSLNQNSWTKFAKLLFIEAPIGVGYSYSTDGSVPSNLHDEQVVAELYEALKNFYSSGFDNTAPLYIAADGYASIYATKLAFQIIMDNPTFPILKGVAIGNGLLDQRINYNSLPHSEFYRGGITITQYQSLLSACCSGYSNELDCDFSSHFDSILGPLPTGNSSDPCYQQLMSLGMANLVNSFDPYNFYEQCYRLLAPNVTSPAPVGETWTGINYDSSDPNSAYWCYQQNAISQFMNSADVKRALNIPTSLQNQLGTWKDATTLPNYIQQQSDIEDDLQNILLTHYYTNNTMQMLIYNGDTDRTKSWLSADLFSPSFESYLYLQESVYRYQWTFSTDGVKATLGGYATRYTKWVDLVTIRGAGLYAAQDRPAQMQQLIYNWICSSSLKTGLGTVSFDTCKTVDMRPTRAPSPPTMTSTASTSTSTSVTTRASTTSGSKATSVTAATTTAAATTATTSTSAATTTTTTRSSTISFLPCIILLFTLVFIR